MPENLDRPPAEDFDGILKQLYKEKLIADRGTSKNKKKRTKFNTISQSEYNE
jgi:hypothetical protein